VSAVNVQVVTLTRADQEMIVVSPQWLCSDIIGKFLSHDCFTNRPADGRFLLQDLQAVFAKSDAQDIAFILDALELCSASHQRGEPELTVAGFVHSQAPPTDPPPTNQVCQSTSLLVIVCEALDTYSIM